MLQERQHRTRCCPRFLSKIVPFHSGQGSPFVSSIASSGRANMIGGNPLARHPLISFFLLAYVISWAVWVPYLLSKDGWGIMSFHSPISHTVSGNIFSFGPMAA